MYYLGPSRRGGGLFSFVQVLLLVLHLQHIFYYLIAVPKLIWFIGCMGGRQLLLAILKNASGRIGIFYSKAWFR